MVQYCPVQTHMKSQGLREVTHSKGDQLGGQRREIQLVLLIYLVVAHYLTMLSKPLFFSLQERFFLPIPKFLILFSAVFFQDFTHF